ncbi:4-phosphoerythronate dehydrogenase [Balneola sp. MJW-20]|uniref:4-phosphoerythronate dehydrogenase n=1 Tax=Gracilimonas aurantiaca TaxID=3234185 RepID=UPI0034665BD1
MIKVLADKNLYKLSSFIPEEIDLQLYDPEDDWDIPPDCDALLIRTVSPVNPQTLPEIPGSLSFIATGSSGTDHIDTSYLKQNNISIHDAKGCNARAVAEYVITALLLWAEKNDTSISNKTIGIIGCGNVGSTLGRMLDSFGIAHTDYDPPREISDLIFKSAALEEVLDADILSFHTPLVDSGLYPTHHWLNGDKLEGRKFDCIINSSRGGVTDELAVLEAYDRGRIGCLITDVWENEPELNQDMLEHSFIATPHIAGYSEQAKLKATMMICEALAEHFELTSVRSDLVEKSIKVETSDITELSELLRIIHPIMEYDHKLRAISLENDSDKLFRKLRTGLPFRYEYQNIKMDPKVLDQYQILYTLGCKSY